MSSNVTVYKGFTEHAYRLLFPYEDRFDSSPQLKVVLPNGKLENDKKLRPEREKGILCYTYAQNMDTEEKAKPYIDSPFVWQRDDETWACVQCWPASFNAQFKESFTISPGQPPPDGGDNFQVQAAQEFEQVVKSLFGADALGKVPVLYCHRKTENMNLTYAGTSEALTELLRSTPNLQEVMRVRSVGLPDNPLGFLSVIETPKDKTGKNTKPFAMQPHEQYVLYMKQGWESMACVKPLHQFLRECTFLDVVRPPTRCEGFTEFSDRLLFPYEENFADLQPPPHLCTILPNGAIENNKVLAPKAEKAIITYASAQQIKGNEAEEHLEQRGQFVFPQEGLDMDSYALVQTWPVSFDQSFKDRFTVHQENQDPIRFDEKAVTNFKQCIRKLFGEGAFERGVQILFAQGSRQHDQTVYCGSSEAIMNFLTIHEEVRRDLNINRLFHDGKTPRFLAFVSGIIKTDWKTKEQYPDGERGCSMHPGTDYVLFVKEGLQRFATVASLREFQDEHDLMLTEGDSLNQFIAFEANTDTLTERSKALLQALARSLADQPLLRLKAYGHTSAEDVPKNADSAVAQTYGHASAEDVPENADSVVAQAKLASKRADRVRTHLESLGVRNEIYSFGVCAFGHKEDKTGVQLSRCKAEDRRNIIGWQRALKVTWYDGFTKVCKNKSKSEHHAHCCVGTYEGLLQNIGGSVKAQEMLNVEIRGEALFIRGKTQTSLQRPKDEHVRHVLYRLGDSSEPTLETLDVFKQTCTFYENIKTYRGFLQNSYCMLFQHLSEGGDAKLAEHRATLRENGEVKPWDEVYRDRRVALVCDGVSRQLHSGVSDETKQALPNTVKPYLLEKSDAQAAQVVTVWPALKDQAFLASFKRCDISSKQMSDKFDKEAMEGFQKGLKNIYGADFLKAEKQNDVAVEYYHRQEEHWHKCYVGTGEALLQHLHLNTELCHELQISELQTDDDLGFLAKVVDSRNHPHDQKRIKLDKQTRYCLCRVRQGRPGALADSRQVWTTAEPLLEFHRFCQFFDEVEATNQNVGRSVSATRQNGSTIDAVRQSVDGSFRMLSYDLGHGTKEGNKRDKIWSVKVTLGSASPMDKHRAPNVFIGLSRHERPCLKKNPASERRLPGRGLHGLAFWSHGDLESWRNAGSIEGLGVLRNKTNLFPGAELEIVYTSSGKALAFCDGCFLVEYPPLQVEEEIASGSPADLHMQTTKSNGSSTTNGQAVYFHIYIEDEASTKEEKTEIKLQFRSNMSCLEEFRTIRMRTWASVKKMVARSSQAFQVKSIQALAKCCPLIHQALVQHHTRGVKDLALVKGGQILISVSADKKLKCFSSAGRCLQQTDDVGRGFPAEHLLSSAGTASFDSAVGATVAVSTETEKAEPQCIAVWHDVKVQQEDAYVIATGCADGIIRLWLLCLGLPPSTEDDVLDSNLASSLKLEPLLREEHDTDAKVPRHRRGVTGLVYHEYTHSLYSCGANTVKKFTYRVDMGTWQRLLSENGGWKKPLRARQMALSPDGSLLAVAIQAWDMNESFAFVESPTAEIQLLDTDKGSLRFVIKSLPVVTSLAFESVALKKPQSDLGSETPSQHKAQQYLFVGDAEGIVSCYKDIQKLVSENQFQQKEHIAPDKRYTGHAEMPVLRIMLYKYDFKFKRIESEERWDYVGDSSLVASAAASLVTRDEGQVYTHTIYFIVSCSANGIVMVHPLNRIEDDWLDKAQIQGVAGSCSQPGRRNELKLATIVPVHDSSSRDAAPPQTPPSNPPTLSLTEGTEATKPEGGTEIGQIWQLVGHSGAVACCAKEYHNIYTGSADHTICQWSFPDMVQAHPPYAGAGTIAFKRMRFAKFHGYTAIKVPVAVSIALMQMFYMVYSAVQGSTSRLFVFNVLELTGLGGGANVLASVIALVVALLLVYFVASDKYAEISRQVDEVDAQEQNPQKFKSVQHLRDRRVYMSQFLTLVCMFLWMPLFQLQIALMDCMPYGDLAPEQRQHCPRVRDHQPVLEVHHCMVCWNGVHMALFVVDVIVMMLFILFTLPLLIVQGDVSRLHPVSGDWKEKMRQRASPQTWFLPIQNSLLPYVGSFSTSPQYYFFEVALLLCKIGFPLVTDLTTNYPEIRLASYFCLSLGLLLVAAGTKPFRSPVATLLLRLACIALCLALARQL
eukprot:TRINITY_DN12249_c0_g1_i1.p1 TRINITY_DN12249_c0_g1~~TRINITY_DN12249_c0_g1_i1.p1  ORF type:complete len:2149 (+),score=272.56 TRINITY_DN12249_c0_g1_i1:123-6569(+)